MRTDDLRRRAQVATLTGADPEIVIPGGVPVLPWTATAILLSVLQRDPRRLIAVRSDVVHVLRASWRGRPRAVVAEVEYRRFPLPATWRGRRGFDLLGTSVFVPQSSRTALIAANRLGVEPNESAPIRVYAVIASSGVASAWLFLVLGGLAAAIGVSELVADATTRRATGLTFLLAGSVAIAASIALSVPRGSPRPATVWLCRLASVSTIAIGLYLAAVSARFGDERIVVGLVWTLGGGVALRWLPPGAMDLPDRSTQQSVLTALASAGLSLGLFWTMIEFGYSQWKPAPGPTVEVRVAVERSGGVAPPGLTAYVARIELENPGASRVALAGSIYRATAITAVPEPILERLTPDGTDVLDELAEQTRARGLQLDAADVRAGVRTGGAHVVQSGLVAPRGWYLEPGERYEIQRLVFVPDAVGAATLRLTVEVVAANGDRLTLPTAGQSAGGSHPELGRVRVWRAALPTPGLLHEVTVGRQTLTLAEWWPHRGVGVVDDDAWPTLRACVADSNDVDDICDDPIASDRRWSDYFEIVTTTQVHETSLGLDASEP